MSHWLRQATKGSEFWISCNQLKLLRKAGRLQLHNSKFRALSCSLASMLHPSSHVCGFSQNIYEIFAQFKETDLFNCALMLWEEIMKMQEQMNKNTPSDNVPFNCFHLRCRSYYLQETFAFFCSISLYSKEILPIAKANKPIQSFARPEKTGLVANSALPLRKALMYLCLLPALPVFERGMSYDTYYKNEQNCL